MTKKELIKAIKKCTYVYASARYTEHDVANIQVLKVDILWHIKHAAADEFNAIIMTDGNLLIG